MICLFNNYLIMNDLDNIPYGFDLDGRPVHERVNSGKRDYLIAKLEAEDKKAQEFHEMTKDFPFNPK